jgi:hypothetical protein
MWRSRPRGGRNRVAHFRKEVAHRFEVLVAHLAARWPIELNFKNSARHCGLEVVDICLGPGNSHASLGPRSAQPVKGRGLDSRWPAPAPVPWLVGKRDRCDPLVLGRLARFAVSEHAQVDAIVCVYARNDRSDRTVAFGRGVVNDSSNCWIHAATYHTTCAPS